MPENNEPSIWDKALAKAKKNVLEIGEPDSHSSKATRLFLASLSDYHKGDYSPDANIQRSLFSGLQAGLTTGDPITGSILGGATAIASLYQSRQMRQQQLRQKRAQVRKVQEYLSGQRSGIRTQIEQQRQGFQTASARLQSRIAQGFAQYSEFTGEGLTTSLSAQRRARAFETSTIGAQETAYRDITSVINRLTARGELATSLAKSLQGESSLTKARSALRRYKSFLEA